MSTRNSRNNSKAPSSGIEGHDSSIHLDEALLIMTDNELNSHSSIIQYSTTGTSNENEIAVCESSTTKHSSSVGSETSNSLVSVSRDQSEKNDDSDYDDTTNEAIQLPMISWNLIENEFNTRYSKVFFGRNAKAHFDFMNEIIEGAKERWRPLQLLDALLCAVYQKKPADHRSYRRMFEHHDALRDSVLKALEACYDEAYGIRRGHLRPAAADIQGISYGILCDIRPPWKQFDTLKSIFLNHSIDGKDSDVVEDNRPVVDPKKRKGYMKRKEISDALDQSQIFLQHSLPDILVRAVENILKNAITNIKLDFAESEIADQCLLRSNTFVVVAPASHMKAFRIDEHGPADERGEADAEEALNDTMETVTREGNELDLPPIPAVVMHHSEFTQAPPVHAFQARVADQKLGPNRSVLAGLQQRGSRRPKRQRRDGDFEYEDHRSADARARAQSQNKSAAVFPPVLSLPSVPALQVDMISNEAVMQVAQSEQTAVIDVLPDVEEKILQDEPYQLPLPHAEMSNLMQTDATTSLGSEAQPKKKPKKL